MRLSDRFGQRSRGGGIMGSVPRSTTTYRPSLPPATAGSGVPSTSSGPDGQPNRPFRQLGKGSVNLFGRSPVAEEPFNPATAAPKSDPAFKDVPVLGNISGFLGDLADNEVATFIFNPVGRWKGEANWQKPEYANDPIRLKYEEAIARGAISQHEAEAQYLRVIYDREGRGGIFRDIAAPGTANFAGAYVMGAVGLASAPQSIYVRNVLQPMLNRIDSFSKADDAALENNPRLIELRDRYNSGRISKEDTLDELILEGFGASNPMGAQLGGAGGFLASLGIEVSTDPVNMLSLGGATLARTSVKAGVRAMQAAMRADAPAITAFTDRMAAAGVKLNDAALLQRAWDDETVRPVILKALEGESRMTQFLVRDAPTVRRIGNRIERVLDPLTLFGNDRFAKFTQQRFAQRIGLGVLEGYGPNTYRTLIGKANGMLGRDAGNALADGFDRAGMQLAVQVGNEASIRHILTANNLSVVGEGAADATAAARRSAELLRDDITTQVKAQAQRVRHRIVPLRAGREGLQEALAEARARASVQLQNLTGTDAAKADAFVRRLDEDELSLLDFQHYGKVVGDFVNARKSDATTRAGNDTFDRVTFVGPRQLTTNGVTALKQALKSGDMGAVRGIIGKYDDLYRTFGGDFSDAELRELLEDQMDRIAKYATPVLDDTVNLGPELANFIAKYKGQGYHLGLRPADADIARPVYDRNGRIVGVNPWVDYVDETSARQSIGRLKALRMQVFGTISGEQVYQHAQDRFIRFLAEDFGVPEEVSKQMFSNIRKAGEERKIGPRGLDLDEVYRAAMDTNVAPSIAREIDSRRLTYNLMRAFEGSVGTVGITQKFTGRMKSLGVLTTGSNALGIMSERIYPWTRFKINPFFQWQEAIESPFFMLLRGRIPARDLKRVWRKEGRAELMQEVDKSLWVQSVLERRGSFVHADQLEYSTRVLASNDSVRNSLAAAGVLQRVVGRIVPNVVRIKDWAQARSFEYELADRITRAVERSAPGSAQNYNSWLAARARHGNRERAATSTVYDWAARSDPDSIYSKLGPKAFKPEHLGRQARISRPLIQELVLGPEGRDLNWTDFIRRVRDPGDTTVTVQNIERALKEQGADPVYIERAITLATFPGVREFWDGFRRLGRTDEEIAAMRQSHQRIAQERGMDEQDYLTSVYADSPAGISEFDGNPVDPHHFQMIARAFEGFGREVVPATSELLEQLSEIGRKYLPDMTLPDNWRTMKVKDLTKAQQKARNFQLARERRALDPARGLPPTPDNNEGVILDREGRLRHKIGEVNGEEWWEMLNNTMSPEQMREMADWYIDMRRGFLALVENDPEKAAQMLMLFGVSQLNTSPVDGMRFLSRALYRWRQGGELPTDQKFSGLNSGLINKALIDSQLDTEGLGQKLMDFVDSLLGIRERTAGVRGPDPDRPWMPAAADIWAKRDLGFIDEKMESHLKRVYGARTVRANKLQSVDKDGNPKFRQKRDSKNKPMVDGDGNPIMEPVMFVDSFDIELPDGKTIHLDRSKITGGAPDDDEYDYIVGFYNDRAHEANAQINPDGTTGWLGRDNWTAAEMQAMGWFRAKLATGDNTGLPTDAFFRNRYSVHWEAVPSATSRFGDIFPDDIPDDIARDITSDIGLYAEMEARRLLGVETFGHYLGIGTWNGNVAQNAAFDVFGNPVDAEAFARVMGYLTQQDAVIPSRLSPLGADPDAGRFHAMDWNNGGNGMTRDEAEALMQRLFDEDHPVIKGGASIVRYDNGTFGVRSIWMDGKDMASFRKAVPDEPGAERVVVESIYASNDWTKFPDGEEHIDWLKGNGYAAVADELVGSGRHRAALFYERAHRKHYAQGLADWRGFRALGDPEWESRAGALVDDLSHHAVESERLDDVLGPDLVARARGASERGDTFFQRAPRGTLGAVQFDALSNRARVYLNAKHGRADTWLHEWAHIFAEQSLDPSGRKLVLDAYNAAVGRPGRKLPKKAPGQPIPTAKTTWDEEVHEWFVENYIRWVKTGDAPTIHMEPIFGHYQKSLKGGRRQKPDPSVAAIIQAQTTRRPKQAYGFNGDEEALLSMMLAEGDRASRNARDLIHFRSNRSWLERSLNHPYFGLYPLSYMWGKVLPELVEFLVFRPFGLKAPMVAYNTVADIYNGVMLQQEYDPELREYLADHEEALRAIAMLTPGLPWDLPVNSPLWMRRIAEAVATQNQRVLDGKLNPDGTPAQIDLSKIDLGRIATDVTGYAFNPINGYSTIAETVSGLGAVAGMAAGAMTDQPDATETPALTTEQPGQQGLPPVVPPQQQSIPMQSQPAPIPGSIPAVRPQVGIGLLAPELAEAAEELEESLNEGG